MSTTTPRTTPTPGGTIWESIPQAARRTGFGPDFIRDKVADGSLCGYRATQKPGAAIRVKAADVDAMFVPIIPEDVR
ncbi:hypothetical protein [Williamsia herbipolensis]|uniref:hypothetical protein n=1 Tax=Williamsia herbipolensis TaxID=1603258 RepID=UPI0005F80795|nr:hypothetical protein [Williamsia herbipolensis]